MEYKIEFLNEKKLVGQRLKMSFAHNQTSELWRAFMPRRREIANAVNADLYSLQRYGPAFFAPFNPLAEFEKWAAVEIPDFSQVPAGMETLTLPAGLYAVFAHKGSSTDNSTFEYIFGTWLPQSEYDLDDRPHFEVLGAKYKNNDPDSEEEIWIPVRVKPT